MSHFSFFYVLHCSILYVPVCVCLFFLSMFLCVFMCFCVCRSDLVTNMCFNMVHLLFTGTRSTVMASKPTLQFNIVLCNCHISFDTLWVELVISVTKCLSLLGFIFPAVKYGSFFIIKNWNIAFKNKLF